VRFVEKSWLGKLFKEIQGEGSEESKDSL